MTPACSSYLTEAKMVSAELPEGGEYVIMQIFDSKTDQFFLSLQIIRFRSEAEKKVVYAKNFRKRH